MTGVGGDGPTMRHSLHCVGFQTVLARSCQWAAGRDVTIDVPGEFPPPDDVSIVRPENMHWAAEGKTLPFAPQAIENAKERVTLKKSRKKSGKECLVFFIIQRTLFTTSVMPSNITDI